LDLGSATFGANDFRGCRGRRMTVMKVDLSRCDFRGAELTECNFTSCRFDETNFAGANLERTLFFACEGDGVSFENVTAGNVRFANLFGAGTLRMRLDAVTNFEGANLEGVQLIQPVNENAPARS